MNKLNICTRIPVFTVLSAHSYRVYDALCYYNHPLSLFALAQILHESERSIKRAIKEIKEKGFWCIKFQVLTDVLIKDDIYCVIGNLNDVTLDNILSSKKYNNTYSTSINSACAQRTLWSMKVQIKEYLVSLLAKDVNKLRYCCKVLGVEDNASMDKQTMVDLLHDRILVRFVKYEMNKMGTAFFDKTEKELYNHYKSWLFKNKEWLRDEVKKVFTKWKYDPKEEMEAGAFLYMESLKIDMGEVNKKFSTHRNAG